VILSIGKQVPENLKINDEKAIKMVFKEPKIGVLDKESGEFVRVFKEIRDEEIRPYRNSEGLERVFPNSLFEIKNTELATEDFRMSGKGRTDILQNFYMSLEQLGRNYRADWVLLEGPYYDGEKIDLTPITKKKFLRREVHLEARVSLYRSLSS